ncbi:MAG: metallophosphoesterase [Verrucomicrobiota bacterium]
MMRAIYLGWLVFLSLSQLAYSEPEGPEKEAQFSHSVTTAQKPWTNREFRNNPRDFQFAIVTDRTGGMRPGVFPRAVAKVNELQPEFVITVGDLIAGGRGQRNEEQIHREWEEFNGFIEKFEMPFFYLPGNHDVSNEVMDRIWDEMFGARYYSFRYHDVLFLCLNTQGGEGTSPFLGSEQISWAKKEIEKHSDVRWTMVFLHQPLWVMEEGIRRNVNGESVIRKSKTGWPEIEAALAGRKHTVYAGHVHRYAKYERNKANYYTLGTTGGGSAIRGSGFGEFDHATWITMTDEGPRMMNLTLDGMLADDVTTEAMQKFWRGLQFSETFRETFPFQDKTLTLPLKNPLSTALSGNLSWILPATEYWTVSPRRLSVELEPGEEKEIQFAVSHEGDLSNFFPLPRLDAHFHGEGRYHLERGVFLPMDLTEHVKKYPEKTSIFRVSKAPEIDGSLEDSSWRRDPAVSRLIPRQADGYAPVESESWIGYDEEFLYLGIRCEDPILRDVIDDVTARDGDLSGNDTVELFFDTNLDQKTYYQFTVNPRGTLHDSRNGEKDWDSGAKVATGREEGAWVIELAIPLADLGADPGEHSTWGFQMTRHRPRLDGRRSYQWSPTFWYGNALPSFFGRLALQ